MSTMWHRIPPVPSIAVGILLLVVVNPTGEAAAQVFFVQGQDGDAVLDCEGGACTLGSDLVVTGVGAFESVDAEPGAFDSLETDDLTVGISIWLPECPQGYTRNTTCAACDLIVLCVRGRDEMVKVGDVWVDRYEASVWSDDACTVGLEDGVPFGVDRAARDYPATFPDHGQVDDREDLLYACSVRGVEPSGYLTWFQAQAACRASGKRLITNAEWQAAVSGTYDPGDRSADVGRCNTNSTTSISRATGRAGSTPGGDGSCISIWGVEDLIGNLAEWTADWLQAGTGWDSGYFDGAGIASWPEDYGDGEDGTWSLDGRARSLGVMTNGLPGVQRRGGNWDGRVAAGAFALSVESAPSYMGAATGFRCAVR